MPARLPLAVAAGAAATLLAGGLVAADLRRDAADERARDRAAQVRLAEARAAEDARLAAARAAAERRAAVAARAKALRVRWQAQLAPVVAGVVTHVQPLVTAFDGGGSRATAYGPNVRDDVLSHGGSLEGLTALRARLATITPPAADEQDQAGLVRALAALRAVAVQLDAATRAEADDEGTVPAFTPAVAALRRAVVAWEAAVQRASADVDSEPAVPTAGITLPSQRSRGAYLQKVGERCAVALQQIEKRFDPDPESLDESARNLVGLATAQSGALAQVLAVPRPATRAAAALPAALTAHRRNLGALTKALDPALPLTAQAARVLPVLEAVDASNARAVAAFRAVGSDTCVLLADDV